jgi:ADP-heptose:LPS heptosyltransferase
MRVEILLRNRIGDTIMGLPAVLCLKQLQQAYGPQDMQVMLYVIPAMLETVKALKLYDCQTVTGLYRFQSWFKPADHTFILYPHSRNVFLNSKKSYGLVSPAKGYLRYDQEMPYLYVEHYDAHLPKALVTFLKETYGFSGGLIRYFGICLELGYTVDQVLETFAFDQDSLRLDGCLSKPNLPVSGDYLVFCMEAGYDSKRDIERRWSESHYFDLAKRAYETQGLKSVFIGLKQTPPVPAEPYCIDLRQERPLMEIAGLLRHTKGYIGNDTGFLHYANLLQVPALCIYSKTDPETYGPLFPQLNTAVRFPDSPMDVFPFLDSFLAGGPIPLQSGR